MCSFTPSSILNDALKDLGCSGALLAVSEDGHIRTYAAGDIAPDAHDRGYYIYSISKTFTAVAVLALCEEHGDFLDTTYASHFPDTTIPQSITIRQLLNHTSGLSDYFGSAEYQRAIQAHPTQPWSFERIMQAGLRQTPLFAPGSGWSYSNPGYGLLKALIEQKSGKPYYDYLTECIIDQAQLSQTRPFLQPDTGKVLLEGHDDSFEGDFRPQYHPDWIVTGCFISTVSDIARFYDALFAGRLISEASLAQMTQTVNVLPNPPKTSIPSYGLGLMHARNSPVGKFYGHGGGGPGYTTYAIHFPELAGHAISLSLVLNKSLPQTPFALADNIAQHYIETH